MHNFTALACLASLCLFLQDTNAFVCTTTTIKACGPAAKLTGEDRKCSVFNTCINGLCNPHDIDFEKQLTINDVRRELGCVNGASGLVYSTVAIVVGVCLQRLF
ncbi:uncharacterized protein LOC130048509 [Ostrea edulis]|uniref:uncharacterized protein LOC130048509 n=1 Tax=Ostrea edulis TaxID=37623 RepID=UPI0024AEF9B3|nr:uncharacterized protein LOC130048509 [Ostrea edulis]